MQEMVDEQNNLRELISQIMWHMRGSLSREEAWTLCHDERTDILKAIKERKEATEKTGLPLL